MTKKITIVENIMSANQKLAQNNRNRLDQAGIFSINLMASPGAGKTSLIEKTLGGLRTGLKIAVIDGDIATSIDADRATNAGAIAVQINTGGECHLDAVMFQSALDQLDNLSQFDLLIVENVGNLICPAAFQLGTHKSVLIASIPEGDDKPYKYPTMYQGVDLLVINKIDLLPYIPFRMEYFIKGVKILNPELEIITLSCMTEEGFPSWLGWIKDQVSLNRG